jgi:hypothetical protein
MKVNEVTDTLLALEQWSSTQSFLIEDSTSIDSVTKNLLQKAIDKFRKEENPSDAKTKEMEDYMAKLEIRLGQDEKVEKSTLQKFFGFFRKHPRMIGLGVIILMLLSPILPQIAVIGLSLEKILSVILAGLYTIDIASPAVKTAMEL